MMPIKDVVKKIVFKVLEYSLNSASKEQGFVELKQELEKIIPDLSEQYTSVKIEGDYFVNKLRSLYAFQIDLAQTAISLLDKEKQENPTLVDIGDSSGAHLKYITALSGLPGHCQYRAVSVNLDPEAVKKNKRKRF